MMTLAIPRSFMTPERFRQIRNLYEGALEYESASRVSFLEEACRGDHELYSEVERLLTAHELTGGFLRSQLPTTPIGPAAFTPVPESEDEPIPRMEGRRIGAYRVLREIGRGGMGAVYLASRVDEAFHRLAAIKIIRGAMGSADVIRRFRQEREILASLDHPNIARLIDGGSTEEGLPYFVMEYVEGQPIDQYCNQRKLRVSDRLRLFRTVCAAVQYAHQNLIVHRDLKPRNILVTADGAVKLLDFGIAKLLRTGGDLGPVAAIQTHSGIRVMTPEYASPEQVKGEPISTASDTYSLGVVLYELLTGRRPYRMKSQILHEVARVICEEEPTRPSTAISQAMEQSVAGEATADPRTPEHAGEAREGSTARLRRRLKGDLDNILLKSLRKEPQRRYTSAELFNEDIRRHLEGLPVSAQKDTLWYRSGKFLRRNRMSLTAAACLAIAIAGGIFTTRWQAAKAQRNEIPARINTSHQRWLEERVRKESGDVEARAALVGEYLQTGFLLEETRGDYQGALESHRKAVHIAQELADLEPGKMIRASVLAWSLTQAGRMSERVGDIPGAVTYYHRALVILEHGLETYPYDDNLRETVIELHLAAATAANKANRRQEALDHLRKALAVSEGIEWTQFRDDEPLAFKLSGRLWSLGLQFESLASDATQPVPIRKERRQQAGLSFERSLRLFNTIKKPLPPLAEIENIQKDFYNHLPAKILRSKDELQKLVR
jgi:serine/threonine protein kinase